MAGGAGKERQAALQAPLPAPAPAAAAAPQRSIAPWLVVGGLISVAAILLATRGIDLAAVADAIGSASPPGLAAGTLLLLASYPLLALRWRSIASALCPPGPVRMCELTLIGAAVNNALPARLGEVARSVGLARASSRPVLAAFGTVIVDRVADVIFFAAVFGLTVGASPTPGWVRWVGVGGAILTVALVAALGAVALIMARRDGPPPTGRITRHLATLGEGLRCVRTWGGLVTALALTAAAWGVWMVGAWFIADAIGVRLSLSEVLFTTGLLGLGSAVPSAPGFIGTYHWIATSALGLFGVGGADALAFALLLHAAWFIPTTVLGAVFMVRWGLTFAALRRTSTTRPAVT